VLAAKLAGWPTPVANDDNKSPEAHLAMKTRMGHRDGSNANRTAITSLQVMVKTITGWVSPTATDGERGSLPPRPQDTGIPLSQQFSGLTPASSSAETANTAAFQLNPRFSLWLMGFPTSWHDAGVSALRSFEAQATPSSRKTLPSSSKPTSTPRKLLT
jgi:hypothetical protein